MHSIYMHVCMHACMHIHTCVHSYMHPRTCKHPCEHKHKHTSHNPRTGIGGQGSLDGEDLAIGDRGGRLYRLRLVNLS